MILTGVEILPGNRSSGLVLGFSDPDQSDVYQVKGITGLDAASLIPNYYATGVNSGLGFYDFNVAGREIAIKIGLNPNFANQQTYSSLRDEIYKLISTTRNGLISFRFLNGGAPVAQVTGYIAKVEGDMFEANQEITITIVCQDPILRSPSRTTINISGLNPLNTTITDPYSTAPHGFDLVVQANADVDYLNISDGTGDWNFKVRPVNGFNNGDKVYVSSEINDKSVYMVRSGVTTHMADAIQNNSVWPMLFPGKTKIVCSANWNWVSISHKYAYWGV